MIADLGLAATTDELTQNAEDLCYNEFILPAYPDGLRAFWGGVYSTYLTSHPDDDWYNPHNVISESTTLLAQLAALRGDEGTLVQMLDLLEDPARHGSDQFQLFQWLLDLSGTKVSLGAGYANAAGEENRMLEVLKVAKDQFGEIGLRNYRTAEQRVADGMKGINGGIGNFEPPPYQIVYETAQGTGGDVDIKFPGSQVNDVLILGTQRNTPYGYSLYEVELLDAVGNNAALLAEPTASTVQNEESLAQKAADGDLSTRWSSLFQDPQWLALHFSSPQNLSRAKLLWETASARAYQVVALQTMAQQAGSGTKNVVNFTAKKARYICFQGLQPNASTGEHNVTEIKVFHSSKPAVNLAAGKHYWISADPGIPAVFSLTDGSLSTSAGSSNIRFWVLIDLGAVQNVNRVEINWGSGPDPLFAIQLQPEYTAVSSDGYLLRPQFVWKEAEGSEVAVTNAGEVTDITLGNINFAGLYHAGSWLSDSFYTQAASSCVTIAKGSQNVTSGSAGYGLFHNKYNVRTHAYESEYGDNVSTLLSNCDIAARLGAYGELTGNTSAVTVGRRFCTFLKNVYNKDGAIWAGYDYNTGQAKWKWEDLATSAFVAKLFIQFNEFTLAEKVIREKILPKQRLDVTDSYFGAIMDGVNDTQAQNSKYSDAGAFPMLESLVALHQWRIRPKGTWKSVYPKEWITVSTVNAGDGGEDILTFTPVNARYVRILCKQKINPDWGYSLFSFNAYASSTATTNLALNKSGSVSTVQFDDSHYQPMSYAFDGNDASRWASRGGADYTTEWIYVDLGSTKKVGKVRLLWENAYATQYEVQIALPSN